jgi:hypothetical protein
MQVNVLQLMASWLYKWEVPGEEAFEEEDLDASGIVSMGGEKWLTWGRFKPNFGHISFLIQALR